MLHFQTSIDSLTLTAIEPSCSTDKEAISGYCDAIVDDAESCNVSQSSSRPMSFLPVGTAAAAVT